jgi:signal transduction histidine kinase/ActR/RegA family two-component response regulator
MNANRKISILIRKTLPVGMRSKVNVFFTSFSLCALLGLSALTSWFGAMGNVVSAVSTLIAAAVVAFSMMLWRMGVSQVWVGSLYQTGLLGVILFNATLTGGVTSPALGWLAIVPLLPLFTQPRLWANIWIWFSLISVLAMYCAQINGWLLHITQFWDLQPHMQALGHMDSSMEEMTFGASMFGLLVIAQLILVKTYDAANERSLRQLRQSNLRLETLSRRLQIANKHKDAFVAMVSHEMRTPLNAVMGYLGLIGMESSLNEKTADYVQGARNSAAHLVTVINDLLDFSQIQQGKLVLNPHTVNLRETLTSSHQTLAPRALGLSLDYRLGLDAGLPEWAVLDSHRLAQVTLNLLGNALKFTQYGHVLMRAWFEPLGVSSGNLCICVQDSGTGIPKESWELIFEPFVQLQLSSNHLRSGHALHGNGLGLAITRSLVQSQGGSIELTSEIGKGSEFTVRIPILIAQAPSTQLNAQHMCHDAKPKLLIVDDHATNRLVASATIQRSMPDAHIEQACNGTEAIEKMSSTLYDLVLMDLIMPDLSGTDVVRHIRSQCKPPFSDVPVIALTANVAEEAVKECFDVGMKEVLPKPFDKTALIHAILRHARNTVTA